MADATNPSLLKADGAKIEFKAAVSGTTIVADDTIVLRSGDGYGKAVSYGFSYFWDAEDKPALSGVAFQNMLRAYTLIGVYIGNRMGISAANDGAAPGSMGLLLSA